MRRISTNIRQTRLLKTLRYSVDPVAWEESDQDWKGKTVIPLCTAYTAEYKTLKDIVKATPDAEHLDGLAVITTKMNGEGIDKKFPQIDAWLKKLNL